MCKTNKLDENKGHAAHNVVTVITLPLVFLLVCRGKCMANRRERERERERVSEGEEGERQGDTAVAKASRHVVRKLGILWLQPACTPLLILYQV